MNLEEYKQTREGRRLDQKIRVLYDQINDTITIASRNIDDCPKRAFLDWDDSGFFWDANV